MVPFGFAQAACCVADSAKLGVMPRPKVLRIVKRIAGIPVLGICERCNSQFPAEQSPDAESTIRAQFAEHKCKLIDSSQNALRIVRESTEGK
jgi:hypothetical protein